MSLAQLINRPCVVIRRSSEDIDEFSGETPGETREDTVCELQQTRRDEPEGQGESSETTWDVFFLIGTDPLSTGDAVVVASDVYETLGDSWEARNPRTQQLSHVEATVKFTGTEEVGS